MAISPDLTGVALLLSGLLCFSALMLGLIRVILRSRPQRRGPQRPDAKANTASGPAADGSVPISVAGPPSYIRQAELLTRAERDFLAVLRAAAPAGWHIFPQVRLANLIMPHKGDRHWQRNFNYVAAKCVDFVLCDGHTISPQLVVELDDSSHSRTDRRKRDDFVDAALGSAGLPILHVRWQRQYDADDLAAAIRRAAGLAPAPVLPAPSIALPADAPPRATPPEPLRPALLDRAPPTPPGTRWACRQCNAEVGATAKFCPGCGATLEL